jgi:hypothetical protein
MQAQVGSPIVVLWHKGREVIDKTRIHCRLSFVFVGTVEESPKA